MITNFFINWSYVPGRDLRNVLTGSEAEQSDGLFRGAAILDFFKKYEDDALGLTFEGTESDNRLGLTSVDRSYLEKNGIPVVFGEKPGYIQIHSITTLSDPVT
jgi:hypothetical protein